MTAGSNAVTILIPVELQFIGCIVLCGTLQDEGWAQQQVSRKRLLKDGRAYENEVSYVAIPTETSGSTASCSYMVPYYAHFPTAHGFTI